eukprot:tig00000076_g2332.t1
MQKHPETQEVDLDNMELRLHRDIYEAGMQLQAPAPVALRTPRGAGFRRRERAACDPQIGSGHNDGADDFDDVQRLYIVLRPFANQKTAIPAEHLNRLLIVPKKQLPKLTPKGTGRKATHLGFVQNVSSDIEDISRELLPKEYETATRGHRVQGAARPAGEGVYEIMSHSGKHTHLAYFLELPADGPGEVQEALNIPDQGSYILQIKNPEASTPFGPKAKPEYPKKACAWTPHPPRNPI